MNYTKEEWKRTETSIKNNEIEGYSRDGRAKKYTNKICRDYHVHYIHDKTNHIMLDTDLRYRPI